MPLTTEDAAVKFNDQDMYSFEEIAQKFKEMWS
jgi:hypothetical protein